MKSSGRTRNVTDPIKRLALEGPCVAWTWREAEDVVVWLLAEVEEVNMVVSLLAEVEEVNVVVSLETVEGGGVVSFPEVVGERLDETNVELPLVLLSQFSFCWAI